MFDILSAPHLLTHSMFYKHPPQYSHCLLTACRELFGIRSPLCRGPPIESILLGFHWGPTLEPTFSACELAENANAARVQYLSLPLSKKKNTGLCHASAEVRAPWPSHHTFCPGTFPGDNPQISWCGWQARKEHSGCSNTSMPCRNQCKYMYVYIYIYVRVCVCVWTIMNPPSSLPPTRLKSVQIPWVEEKTWQYTLPNYKIAARSITDTKIIGKYW